MAISENRIAMEKIIEENKSNSDISSSSTCLLYTSDAADDPEIV